MTDLRDNGLMVGRLPGTCIREDVSRPPHLALSSLPGVGGGVVSTVLHAAALLVICRLVLAPLPYQHDAAPGIAMVFVAPAAPAAPSQSAAPAALSQSAALAALSQPAAPAVSSQTIAPAASSQPAVPPAAQDAYGPAAGTAIPRMPTRRSERRAVVPARRSQPNAAGTMSTNALGGMPQESRSSVTAAEAGTPTPTPALDPDPVSVARFTGLVQRAVQAAAIYPPVARRMAMQGRVQVRFEYAGGAVSDISVAGHGASAMLDRAAVTAVREAAYPPAPAPIGRHRLGMVVWVDFRLQPEG